MMRNCCINADQLAGTAFRTLAGLAETCPAYRIIYGSLGDGMRLVEKLAAS